MKDVADYTDKITSEHRNSPKFIATVSLSVAPYVALQAFLAALPSQFDLDAAVGAQLDVVGQWINQSREISVPIPDVYFAFDDDLRGFDRGVWKGPYDQEYGIDRLDDDTYRRLLRTLVLANSWDGTAEHAQQIYNFFFDDPATAVFIQDDGSSALQNNFFAFNEAGRGFDESVWYTDGDKLATLDAVDMVMIVGVAGKIPSPVYLAILEQGLIRLHPAGVQIIYLAASKDNSPLFGFDTDNDVVAGFDRGAWGVAPSKIAYLPI